MTATPQRTPTYRFHKATGQAYVELNARRIYLGRYDLPETREHYHRLIAEWEAAGRRPVATAAAATVLEVIDRFWQHAKTIYVKSNGHPSSELDSYRQVLRPLKQLYGSTLAADFGPPGLKVVRQVMVEKGWARTHINKQISRLRTVFRWATEEELIAASVFHALQAVRGLQRGRTEARETQPVRPVPDLLINGIRPYVSRQVWAMIQVQLLTGCRPDEVVRLRGINFTNTRGDVWVVSFEEHKTARFGIAKAIFFGPKAREVAAEFLKDRPLHLPLFSAAEAERERREELGTLRKTPVSCGKVVGSHRKSRPQRQPRHHYSVDRYRRAIERGCDLAFPPPDALKCKKVEGKKGQHWESAGEWRARLGQHGQDEFQTWRSNYRWIPNRLRHNAATQLRQEFGIDGV